MAGVPASWDTICYWVEQYYQSGFFLILTAVAWCYLFAAWKELRGKLLVLIVLILLVAINPVLYGLIYYRIIYWRLFWMLPSGLLVGLAVVRLLGQAEKQKAAWLKWVMLAAVSISIIMGGRNMFTHGGFIERENWEKVSKETKDVCDIILAIDESPRIVAPAGINSEVRQYAPEIEMLYGRNAEGYIGLMDWNTLTVRNELQKEAIDYTILEAVLLNYEIGFIVTERELAVEEMTNCSYVEIGRTEQSIIYYNEER